MDNSKGFVGFPTRRCKDGGELALEDGCDSPGPSPAMWFIWNHIAGVNYIGYIFGVVGITRCTTATVCRDWGFFALAQGSPVFFTLLLYPIGYVAYLPVFKLNHPVAFHPSYPFSLSLCAPHPPQVAMVIRRAADPESQSEADAPAVVVDQRTEEDPLEDFLSIAATGSTLGSPDKDPRSMTKVDSWRWEETPDAVVATGILLTTLALGSSPWATQSPINDLFYFMALAVCTIYIGSHRGLTNRARQNIGLQQGALAPVLASVALFGMYLFLKLFPDLNLQQLVNGYFWLLGTLALSGSLGGPLAQIAGPLGEKNLAFQVPKGWLIDEDGKDLTQGNLAVTDLLILPLAMGIATCDAWTNHQIYPLNNLIACLIATDIMQLVGLKSFKTAAALLMGMLCYDVFWVFGSGGVTQAVTGTDESVMVAVATSDLITGPIKLEFPRYGALPGDYPWSILGLGDIAIPGLLAALALRYDASRTVSMTSRARACAAALDEAGKNLNLNRDDSTQVATILGDAMQDAFDRVGDREDAAAGQRRRSLTDEKNDVGKEQGQGKVEEEEEEEEELVVPVEVMGNRNYFWPVMWAYGSGLLVAFGANAVTHAGQPALLYLCPMTLGAVAWVAGNRGDFDRVWNFVDVSRSPMEKAEQLKKQGKNKERSSTD